MPLLLCQADDGVVLPVLSNGALLAIRAVAWSRYDGTDVAELAYLGVTAGLRFGTDESVARNGKRATWLKLPHLTRKIAVGTPQRQRHSRPWLADPVQTDKA